MALENTKPQSGDKVDFQALAKELGDKHQHNPTAFKRDVDSDNKYLQNHGFPDMKIQGVRGNDLVVTTDGGKTVKFMGPDHKGSDTVDNKLESHKLPSGHDIQLRADGSGVYKVQGNDNAWNVSKDILKNRLGRDATNNEIGNFQMELKAENGGRDLNKLSAGQELKIPSRFDKAENKDTQGSADKKDKPDEAKKPEVNGPYKSNDMGDGVNNPLALPGLGGANDPKVKHRAEVYKENINGKTTTKWTGALDNGTWGLMGADRTTFNGEETRDAKGQLLHNQVKYDTSSGYPTITVPDGRQGGTRDMKVGSAETNFDPKKGQYTTDLKGYNGETMQIISDRKGKVVSTIHNGRIEIPMPTYENTGAYGT